MNVEHKDFIALYRGVYPDGYCEHLINQFEKLVKTGAGYTRQLDEGALAHSKQDLQLPLNFGAYVPDPFEGMACSDIFFNGLQHCYDEYIGRFSILANDRIRGAAMKMQRTDPGGGYHIWHCEQGNADHANRALVYMLYLNDLDEEDGGETEFLYQRRRVRPEANTMLLWPAAFTHAHRGNTVLGDKSKYVVTGWFYYE